MSFTDPIVGGETKLIRSAIQSPNYVANVSGWTINRDGSVEFNNAVIRGSVIAGGGVVTLDSAGVTVQSDDTLEVYKVNRTGGFVAARVPDDGSKTSMSAGGVFLTPEDPSPLGTAVDFATIFPGYFNPGAADEAPYLVIEGVEYSGKSAPSIQMFGQSANDANPDGTSEIYLYAWDVHLSVNAVNPSYQRGEYGAFTVSFVGLAGFSVAVNYAKTYSTAPFVDLNIDTAPASTARWVPRPITRTVTGFTAFFFAADAVVNTWVNVPVSWTATEQH